MKNKDQRPCPEDLTFLSHGGILDLNPYDMVQLVLVTRDFSLINSLFHYSAQASMSA